MLRVGRNSARRRVYDRDARAQVAFISRLRSSEMPIATIQHYVDLVRAGDHTVPQRLALMRTYRDEIRRRLDELWLALTVIDYKIASYGGPDTSRTRGPRCGPVACRGSGQPRVARALWSLQASSVSGSRLARSTSTGVTALGVAQRGGNTGAAGAQCAATGVAGKHAGAGYVPGIGQYQRLVLTMRTTQQFRLAA